MNGKRGSPRCNFYTEDENYLDLKDAVGELPINKMGLDLYEGTLDYSCSFGVFGAILIRPENDVLHSIWIPKGATNIFSTEEYQAFTYKGRDYFIYRRPKNHITKVIAS